MTTDRSWLYLRCHTVWSSRLPFVNLVLEFAEFFERDIVNPTHY